jgi:Protein of unknown function (DUF2505)
MRILLDQPMAVSAEAAQAAFVDPAFYQSLGELGGISAPEVRSFSQTPDHVHLELGYRFTGQLNGPAKRLLDPEKITWSQVTEVDLANRRTEVRMVPDSYQGLLSFAAWYELRSEGEGKCTQHFEGDLRVRLPLLGPLAERAIGGSIRQNLAETAHLVERYVSGGNGDHRDTGPGAQETVGPETVGPGSEGPGSEGPGAGGANPNPDPDD